MKKGVVVVLLIMITIISILFMTNRSSNYCKEYSKIYDRCSEEVELPSEYKEDSCIKLVSKRLIGSEKYRYKIESLNSVCDIKLKQKEKEEDLKLPPANITATFNFFPATRAELITNPTLLRYCDHTSSDLCPNDFIEITLFNDGDFDITEEIILLNINDVFRKENRLQSKISIKAHSSEKIKWTPKVSCPGEKVILDGSSFTSGGCLGSSPIQDENIILKIEMGYWERGKDSTRQVLRLEKEIPLRNVTRFPSIKTVRERMFADITFITPYNEMLQRAARGISYDTSTPEYTQRTVENVWNFLDRNMEISYLPQPKPKHIRFPEQVIKEKGGDCDELVYTIVSILEYIGIKTEIINYQDSSFVEVGHSIFRFHDGEKWNAVEATLLGKSDFEQALKRGEENYAKSTKDPQRAQFIPREVWEKGFKYYNPRIEPSFVFYYSPTGVTRYIGTVLLD